MALISRAYTDQDLELLQAALADWTKTAGDCGYCHTGYLPHLLYEKLRGRSLADLVHIWEDGTKIGGFAINGLFDTSFLVFASPEIRGSEAELNMLESAYQTTRQYLTTRQGSEKPVNTDVYNCDSTRRSLLNQMGFIQRRVWDNITERQLTTTISVMPIPDGLKVRTATLDDYAELALLRNDAFGDDWTPEAFRDNVMQKPGYRPEQELVAVAPNGQIATSTVIRLDEINKVGLFEPVGTRRAFQRRGLASTMMLRALSRMQMMGMRSARVEYDATNQAAHALYTLLGFQKKYETLGYQL